MEHSLMPSSLQSQYPSNFICLPRSILSLMTLGARIRQLRQHHGLTQTQLGALAEVGKATVSLWESDDAVPMTNKLIAMREQLDFSIDWLLTGAGTMNSNQPIRPALRGLLKAAEPLPDYAVEQLTKEGGGYAKLIDSAKHNGTNG